jgi:Mg2+-importing ATPase
VAVAADVVPARVDDAFWAVPEGDLLGALSTGPQGLDDREAAARLAVQGPNSLHVHRRHQGVRLFVAQFENPIILILMGATVLSMVLGDVIDGAIILAIIVASGCLGFWQERNAGRAVEELLAQIEVRARVRRGGRPVDVPVEQVVSGDVVELAAGVLVPGDCRVLASNELLVDESALTGESYPAEKSPGTAASGAPVVDRANAVFLGTHVVSGAGTAVVVRTGGDTEFGAVSRELGDRQVTTGFERGITNFGLLLVRTMLVLVSAIFVVNVVLHRPLVDSFLFSVALAVGLTPQLLPAIVAVSLATGARLMARRRVIVRRLDAIEDFGAMTVLCTDKTGTLTTASLRLESTLSPMGAPDEGVLAWAAVNAWLQNGYPNPMDEAVKARAVRPDAVRLDELPYDFSRKRLSVLARRGEQTVLVTKGAFDSVLGVCTQARVDRRDVPVAQVVSQVRQVQESLGRDGFRVLAVAVRELPAARTDVTLADERELTLVGLVAFHDPPKEGAAAEVERLREQGVAVSLVTGDNRHVAAHVAQAVGLSTAAGVLTGAEIDQLTDDELARRCATVTVFAEVVPGQKRRIVLAHRARGEVVGFLGDGINDVLALHTADVGISVDSAVDAAKQTAAIVLLDKSLEAVSVGVRLGRRTFANTLKYIQVTTSANFGNTLSMAVAAAFLPFLPLLPRQILLLNFLSDVPGMTIAADHVDEEQLRAPRAWRLVWMRDFMLTYGLVSSVFDLLTFTVLRLGFHADDALFRSAWFVESTLTELVVMLVLRTNRWSFRSRPGPALLWSSVGVAALALALPFLPVAEPLGLRALPVGVVMVLVGLIVGYALANEAVKRLVPPQRLA